MTDYRIILNAAAGRIYRVLRPYMPDHSATDRALEIERALRIAEKPSAEIVSEILSRLDHHERIPDEIRDHVADVAIEAWAVVKIDRS